MAKVSIDISGGRLKDENLIVGIDLGTTNSLVARVVEGQPECVADVGQSAVVPSVVYLGPALRVGDEALKLQATEPQRVVASVKRLMAKSFEEVKDEVNQLPYAVLPNPETGLAELEIDGRRWTPVEVSAHILRELKQRAEHRLKLPVQRAVVTVPAYFNDAQRQATWQAGQLAGLEVLRIVNEPTAAALAYGLGRLDAPPETVAVYDLGGGTFDISILRIEAGVFEVLSTNGDTHLGGDDLDQAIARHWARQRDLQLSAAQQSGLWALARQAKHRLSQEPQVELYWEETGLKLTLHTTEFEALAEPLLQRSLDCCRRALQDARLEAHQIDRVVMVGGSTRVPLVQRRVGEFFGKPVHTQLDPDTVVALGAAIQADVLAGNRRDLLLLDVTPLSLGIETLGGLMDVLVPRNSKIPCRASRQYTTSADGQSGLDINVFQGERDLVRDNRPLGSFQLKGIPAMPAGLPKVEVVFLIDADGILRVSATELRSGLQQQVVLKPLQGLTDDAVEQQLLESHLHAQADVEARALQESRVEGQRLLEQARTFAEKHAGLFSATDADGLNRHLKALEQELAAPQPNRISIQAAADALDAFAKPLAETVLNQAFTDALAGRSLNEAQQLAGE